MATKSKLINVRDLPIYDPPFVTLPPLTGGSTSVSNDSSRRTEAFPSFREGVISPLRKKVQDSYDAARDTRSYFYDKYAVGRAHTQQAVEYIKDDANVVARGVLITVGGLAGLLIGARGGPIKKIVYTGLGMGTVASLCYPEQAVQLSQTVYDAAAHRARQAYTAFRQDMASKSPSKLQGFSPTGAANVESRPIISMQKPVPRVDEVQSIRSDKPVKLTPSQADFGQGNPVDHDMYTTRGKTV